MLFLAINALSAREKQKLFFSLLFVPNIQSSSCCIHFRINELIKNFHRHMHLIEGHPLDIKLTQPFFVERLRDFLMKKILKCAYAPLTKENELHVCEVKNKELQFTTFCEECFLGRREIDGSY